MSPPPRRNVVGEVRADPLLHLARSRGHRADAADRDARTTVQRRGGGDDRNAVSPDRDRAEAVLAAGRNRDLRQQLAGTDGGRVDAEEELVRRHGSLAVRSGDGERRAQCDEQRRQVVGRIVRADVAADRSAVAHLHVRDSARDLPENRSRARGVVGNKFRVGRHRADLDGTAAEIAHAAQLVEILEIDENVRRGDACLHHVDERLTAGERTRALVLAQQADRLATLFGRAYSTPRRSMRAIFIHSANGCSP